VSLEQVNEIVVQPDLTVSAFGFGSALIASDSILFDPLPSLV